jgi:hypothetical protein
LCYRCLLSSYEANKVYPKAWTRDAKRHERDVFQEISHYELQICMPLLQSYTYSRGKMLLPSWRGG